MNEWWMNKHSWQEMKCLWIKKCCHQWDFSFLVFVTARALPSLVLIAFYVDRLTGQQSALWGPSRSWEMGLLVKEPPALTSSPELWQQQPAINHLQRPSFIFLPVHIQGDALQHGTCTMREVFLPTSNLPLCLLIFKILMSGNQNVAEGCAPTASCPGSLSSQCIQSANRVVLWFSFYFPQGPTLLFF